MVGCGFGLISTDLTEAISPIRYIIINNMAEYMTQSVSRYESGHISIAGTISATRTSVIRIACTMENKIL